jgi:hypothetical protein
MPNASADDDDRDDGLVEIPFRSPRKGAVAPSAVPAEGVAARSLTDRLAEAARDRDVAQQQCSRCRGFFAVEERDRDAWWLCPPCHEVLLGARTRRA